MAAFQIQHTYWIWMDIWLSLQTSAMFYSQLTLQFEKLLNSRLGGSVPRVLRLEIFLRIFQDKIDGNYRLILSLNLQFDLRLRGYIPYGM